MGGGIIDVPMSPQHDAFICFEPEVSPDLCNINIYNNDSDTNHIALVV